MPKLKRTDLKPGVRLRLRETTDEEGYHLFLTGFDGHDVAGSWLVGGTTIEVVSVNRPRVGLWCKVVRSGPGQGKLRARRGYLKSIELLQRFDLVEPKRADVRRATRVDEIKSRFDREVVLAE